MKSPVRHSWPFQLEWPLADELGGSGGQVGKQSFRNRNGALVEVDAVPATEAKNRFGEIVDRVAADGVVAITRHGTPEVVMISSAEFASLASARSESLEALTAA